MSVVALMNPMHKRPEPGQKISVFKKNGTSLDCFATRITSERFVGIVIYCNGRAINENEMAGWWFVV